MDEMTVEMNPYRRPESEQEEAPRFLVKIDSPLIKKELVASVFVDPNDSVVMVGSEKNKDGLRLVIGFQKGLKEKPTVVMTNGDGMSLVPEGSEALEREEPLVLTGTGPIADQIVAIANEAVKERGWIDVLTQAMRGLAGRLKPVGAPSQVS